MATPYLAITDGTTTVTFLNGTTTQAYFIESGNWSPAVAGKRKSPFGGVGPYEDVTEEINCRIIGSSASDCYSKLETLTKLLEQAERWYANDRNTTAVLIKFSPTGSTVTSDSSPLQAAIIGRDEGDETSGVALEPEWDAAARSFHLPIRIRFRRRGLWLGATSSNSSSSTHTGATYSITLATPGIADPVQLQLGNFTKLDRPTLDAATWFISARSNGLLVFDATGMAGGSFASIADAANNANGNVLRCTTTGSATGITTGSTSIGSTFPAANTLVDVYMHCRSTLGSVVNWMARMDLSSNAPTIYFQTEANLPNLVYLGRQEIAPYNTTVTFTVQNPAAAAANLLIENFIFIGADDDQTLVVDMPTSTSLSNPIASNGTNCRVVLDHQLLAKPRPFVGVNTASTSETVALNYSGLPTLFARNTALTVHYCVHGSSAMWRFYDDDGAAVKNLTVTAVQHTSYLTPR